MIIGIGLENCNFLYIPCKVNFLFIYIVNRIEFLSVGSLTKKILSRKVYSESLPEKLFSNNNQTFP